MLDGDIVADRREDALRVLYRIGNQSKFRNRLPGMEALRIHTNIFTEPRNNLFEIDARLISMIVVRAKRQIRRVLLEYPVNVASVWRERPPPMEGSMRHAVYNYRH